MVKKTFKDLKIEDSIFLCDLGLFQVTEYKIKKITSDENHRGILTCEFAGEEPGYDPLVVYIKNSHSDYKSSVSLDDYGSYVFFDKLSVLSELTTLITDASKCIAQILNDRPSGRYNG